MVVHARAKAPPSVVVLAGPNGAGKSTVAPRLLKDALKVEEFVNADTLAGGLSAFHPDRVAFEAAALMLRRIRELAGQRTSFAFETTLAGRTLAPWLRKLASDGHRIHILFLWLSSPDLAVARVARRVSFGGHDVPERTIRRRYTRGLVNFFNIYQSLATRWHVYDNSIPNGPQLIARGHGSATNHVSDAVIWQRMRQDAQGLDSPQPNDR